MVLLAWLARLMRRPEPAAKGTAEYDYTRDPEWRWLHTQLLQSKRGERRVRREIERVQTLRERLDVPPQREIRRGH